MRCQRKRPVFSRGLFWWLGTLTWAETWGIYSQPFPDTPPRYLQDWLPIPVTNAWKQIQIHVLSGPDPSTAPQLISILFWKLGWNNWLFPTAGNTSLFALLIYWRYMATGYVLGSKNRNVTFKSSICSGRTRDIRSLGRFKHCRVAVCSQAPHISPSHAISTTAMHQIQPKLPFLPSSRGTLERHNPRDGWIDTIRSNLIHV